MLFADFCIGIVIGVRIAQRNLEVGIGDFAIGHNLQVLEYLYVALVGVEDYVEVFVRAEHLGQHVTE